MSLLAEVALQESPSGRTPGAFAPLAEGGRSDSPLGGAHSDLGPGERLALSSALYNEACVHALDGQAPKALGALAEAIDAGFDLPELLETDPDFASLRHCPGTGNWSPRPGRRAESEPHERARSALAVTKPYRFDFELPDLGGKMVSSVRLRG